MSTNTNLVDVLAAQDQKEVTINFNSRLLDSMKTEFLTVLVDDSNAVTLTSAQFQDQVGIVFADDSPGPTAQVTITVPALARGLYIIKNNMTQDALVEHTGQSETAPTVTAGEVLLINTGGGNVRGFEAGVANFLALTDTPSTYAGKAGKSTVVNPTETGLLFSSPIVAGLDASSFKDAFKGALLELSGNEVLADETDVQIPWDVATYDTAFTNDKNVTVQKFWLGPQLVFTAATSDTITATAHGMNTGDGPIRLITDGTLPAGLALTTNYWIIRLTNDTFEVALTRANALAGTQVDITDTGTGTHTLDRATRLVVPTGVTRIQLVGGVKIDDPAATGIEKAVVSFKKNESFTFDGRAEESKELIAGTTQVTSFNIKSPVLSVAEGDRFEFNVFQDNETEDNAANAVSGTTTFFGIQMIESDVVIPFPQVLVEKPFAGALITIDSNIVNPVSVANTFVDIDWESAVYDTGFGGVDFAEFVTNPNRITIPSGSGITRVRLKTYISSNGDFTGTSPYIAIGIRKNASFVYAGRGVLEAPVSTDTGGDDFDFMASTAVIDVVGGDFFDVQITSDDTAFTLNTNCWFAIEVIESTQILTFPGVTVYRPNIGALVNKTDANQSVTGLVVTKITFNNTIYDTAFKGTNLFNNGNDTFDIPAGITKIRLSGGIRSDTVASVQLRFRKNGADIPGGSFTDTADTSGTEFISIVSPVIEVVANDQLELAVLLDTTVNVQNDANATYFSIEIVETSDDAFPPEEVAFFINGTPAVTDMIFQKVAVRRFSMADELLDSRAFALTAPSGGAVAFDVQKNAVSIGTITFADGVTTATFVTSGSTQEDFDPADRLSIHSPANLQSMADISFSLFAFRT